MKKLTYTTLTALLLIAAFTTCKKKEESPGSVYGFVTDNTGEPVRTANIQLSDGKSTSTGNDGRYEFSDLKAGEYTLQVNRSGYAPIVNHKVTVLAGKSNQFDVVMQKLPPALKIMVDGNVVENPILDFGSATSVVTRQFSIFNDSPDPLEWDVTATASWISNINRTSGRLNPNATTPAIIITIDRSKLDGGDNTYNIQVTSDNGNKQVIAKAVGEVRILPTLNTHAVTNITTTSAMFNGEVLTNGTPAYTERGFVFSTSPMPEIGNTGTEKIPVSGFSTTRTFSHTISGLTLGTTYYVRAYAINAAGTAGTPSTAYSTNEQVFTPTMVLPSVTTQDVGNRNIGAGTATFNGTIVSVGDPAYTERGFVYGLQDNPTVGNGTKVEAGGSGTGSFSFPMTGLIEGNIYRVRAYAKNERDYAYGTQVTLDFNAVMPAPTTQAPTNVVATSATLNGTITSVGDPAYSERGFVWGTNSNPTLVNSTKVAVQGSGTGIFTHNLTGLTEETTYYVNTYVTYPNGNTVYGTVQNFLPRNPLYATLQTARLMVHRHDASTEEARFVTLESSCRNSTLGGFTDWRLPTIDELRTVWNNRNTIGNFPPRADAWFGRYFSSSVVPDPGGCFSEEMHLVIWFSDDITNGHQQQICTSHLTYPTGRARCVRSIP